MGSGPDDNVPPDRLSCNGSQVFYEASGCD